MNETQLRKLLTRYRAGKLGSDELLRRLRRLPFEDLEFAKVDHHRAIRCGVPEVIYCPGKTPAQLSAIARRIVQSGAALLATRADAKAWKSIRTAERRAKYHRVARCVTVGRMEMAHRGPVVVVSAGTADVPVAEEACVTAWMLGAEVVRLYDVGVAGLHRLLRHSKVLMEAEALVVVAGMEGALPSVVGGLVRKPVIAVPTSVGYGANFQGVTPLLAMMNSCAAGVSVVNIDNGFGAGYLAAMIARK